MENNVWRGKIHGTGCAFLSFCRILRLGAAPDIPRSGDSHLSPLSVLWFFQTAELQFDILSLSVRLPLTIRGKNQKEHFAFIALNSCMIDKAVI